MREKLAKALNTENNLRNQLNLYDKTITHPCSSRKSPQQRSNKPKSEDTQYRTDLILEADRRRRNVSHQIKIRK